MSGDPVDVAVFACNGIDDIPIAQKMFKKPIIGKRCEVLENSRRVLFCKPNPSRTVPQSADYSIALGMKELREFISQ
jgi:hypothetical protein